ncbi:uncharacterized protein IUM83_19430 [Phytophthora cinnamomi]|uniref:uncharacterized protein n=1 Tax=Phytophthora cinnamomi TaxID=4785 RepID=UPI00355A34A3|nr:hypothetical protein IUM83_19430 [Phytophthora cinnamomi]
MIRLSSRSFLHLTPELASEDFDEPFYAKVLRVDSDTVAFRSLDGSEGRVPREVAAQHTVLAGEVNKAGGSSFLRRSVSVQLEHQVQYGQVIAVDGDRLTVRSDEDEFEAAVEHATTVAPIVTLLEHVHFNSDEWSSCEIEAVEFTIEGLAEPEVHELIKYPLYWQG